MRRRLPPAVGFAVAVGLAAAAALRLQRQMSVGSGGRDERYDALDRHAIEPAPAEWGRAPDPEREQHRRRRPVLRRVIPVAVAVVVAASMAGAALAYFTAGATAGSGGAASAASLSLGNTPTLSLSTRDVQVTWTQNSPSFLIGVLGADANGGYLVSRYADSGGGAITPSASCSGLQQGWADPLTCTETGVATGRWTYTVTPKFYNWLGSESAKSTHVIIPPAAPGSVSLTNGGGVGSAYINPSNDGSVNVDVALPSTSLATDTVTLTLSDGTTTVTPATQSGTAGTGTLHFTGIDVSGLADGTITIKAKATSSYGDASGYTSISVTKDTVAPSVSITPSRVPDSNGWYNHSVTFSASTSTDPSPGSGIQACDSDVVYSGPDTSAGSLTFHCTDNAGNTGSNSVLFKYDATGPSGVMSLASSPAPVGAYFASDILYFNPNAAGSFSLVDTVTDATSGPASATFSALSATGWTHSAETVSTPSGGPYQSSSYSWTSGAATPTNKTTTSTDNAGNTAGETFSFVSDSAAPTGGALTVNGTAATSGGSSSSTSSTSFSINSRTNYAETLSATQSGLSSSVLTIQSETLTGSTCGAPGSGGPYTTATTISGTTNPSITAGYCYVYKLKGTDRVGNSASISTTVKVASVTPFGATDLYNNFGGPNLSINGSSQTVTASSVTTTSSRAELIFVHVTNSNQTSGTTVSSISGPFTGATQVAGFSYASKDFEFVWKATGDGSGPSAVTVNFDSGTTSGKVAIDVVELAAGNVVLPCSSCTNSGNSSSASATLSIQSASDTEVAFFGIQAGKTFSTPTNFDQLASQQANGMGEGSYATTCGQNVQTPVNSTASGSGSWGAIGIEIQATAPICMPASLDWSVVSGSAPSKCTYGQDTTGCQSGGNGGTGTFSANVVLVDASQTPITNGTGSAVAVTCTVAVAPGKNGNFTSSTPGSSIPNGSSTTSSAPFSVTGTASGWGALITCSATFNSVIYTIQVTAS
jgi:hypothetical protein